MQLALDALVQWSDTWQLPISINKCCLLNVCKNSHGIVVSIGGSTLPVVTHTRDLGIIVSSDISPSLHVTDIVSKAHMRSALITGGPRGPSPLSLIAGPLSSCE